MYKTLNKYFESFDKYFQSCDLLKRPFEASPSLSSYFLPILCNFKEFKNGFANQKTALMFHRQFFCLLFGTTRFCELPLNFLAFSVNFTDLSISDIHARVKRESTHSVNMVLFHKMHNYVGIVRLFAPLMALYELNAIALYTVSI